MNPEAEYGRRENGEWVAVGRYPDEQLDERRPGAGACWLALRGPVRRPRPGRLGRPPCHPLECCLDGRRHWHRPHRSRAAAPRTSSSRACMTCRCSRRSTRRGVSTTTTAGSTGSRNRRGGGADRWQPRGAGRCFVEAGPSSTATRSVGAGQHTAHLPADDRFISVADREPMRARERDGRVGARVHGQAHGRLAAQHGRLEHLAPALLRLAAVLSVLVRAPERDRVAR